jgi:hypothetical protein
VPVLPRLRVGRRPEPKRQKDARSRESGQHQKRRGQPLAGC